MRHYKKGRKLGSSASHTAAIKKNLVVNLFLNDRIKTTLERAKEIRGDVDRIITWAKRGDVHSRRLAIAKLGDKQLVAEIFLKVEQGLFKDRPGGYTRIFKVGKRRGDDATIVLMELVQEAVQFKKKQDDSEEEKRGLTVEKKAKDNSDATAEAEAEETTEEAAEEVVDEVADESATEEAIEEAAAEEVADADAEEAPADDVTPEEAPEEKEETPEEKAVVEETPAEESSAEEVPESEEASKEDESAK